MVSYSARRVVLAFDPETDDPELLRTVVQLLRLGAIAAAARSEEGLIATAVEKVEEAMGLLIKMDTIKKHASSILKAAGSIQSESDCVHVEMLRPLAQAKSALAGSLGSVKAA